MTIFLKKIIYNLYYFLYLIFEKLIKDQKKKNIIADKFLRYNNERVIKKFENKKVSKIAILLPHCIQNYDCPFKITSDIENCKKCGKCKIGDILKLKEKYNLEVKVATGGTLARLFLKEKRPELVIAVACKRDLISGIFDSFPMNVYGMYNEIINSPCINTNVDTVEMEKIIKKFYKID